MGETIEGKRKKSFQGVPPTAQFDLDEGDNTKFLNISLEIARLPNIDLNNTEELANRVDTYFTICAKYDVKPTVTGLGLALNGMDRRRLWEIKENASSTHREVNELKPESRDIVKKAYKIMEGLWENYMLNGKVNPVAGIFLGKNYYGMQDKQECVITPNNALREEMDISDIRKRYLPQQDIIESEE